MLAGSLVLIAPELIQLILGDKWLPMLTALRLMLIFTLLDPLKQNVANLFLAVGQPTTILKVRLIQLILLVGALFTLGTMMGISGVALSVNLTVVVGIGAFFYKARKFVDFKLTTLFLVPTFALLAGFLITILILTYLDIANDWLIIVMKAILFIIVYGAVLYMFEHQKIWELLKIIRSIR